MFERKIVWKNNASKKIIMYSKENKDVAIYLLTKELNLPEKK